MENNGCSKFFYFIIAIVVVGALINSCNSSGKQKSEPARTATPMVAATEAPAVAMTEEPPVVSEKLQPYVNQARTMVSELGTGYMDSSMMDALNTEYANAEYADAYALYENNAGMFKQSCWVMNNVGLIMMQVDRYEDALTLYFAIQYKTEGTQPESLINLLVAGHALGFSPKELMDAAGMDADTYKKQLSEKNYGDETINDMVRSLCYNIIYMRMEEPERASTETEEPAAAQALDIDALLAQDDTGEALRAQLRLLGTTDQDVAELLTYFDALLQMRKTSSGL